MALSIQNSSAATVLQWTEQGLVPDAVIRAGIRRLCRQRLAEIAADDIELSARNFDQFVHAMDRSMVAPLAECANEQHYEVPAKFFSMVLGPHLKYSCGFWGPEISDLQQSEAAALRITCEHADIRDGQEILDLGCGWGSLSLWIARRFPACRVTSVSNSNSQRLYIEQVAKREGLENLAVITADMNEFEAPGRYDRVVSVEMFEHMRNYRELFGRIHRWLKPGGQFFMHIFCHRSTPYEFLDRSGTDWMSRHFFSGGIMPADDLPLRFQDHMKLVGHRRWNGRHYEKTANAWLEMMDARRDEIVPVLAETYGQQSAERWFQRWRIFFMACAELFGFDDGREWYVSHYLFRRRDLVPVQE